MWDKRVLEIGLPDNIDICTYTYMLRHFKTSDASNFTPFIVFAGVNPENFQRGDATQVCTFYPHKGF